MCKPERGHGKFSPKIILVRRIKGSLLLEDQLKVWIKRIFLCFGLYMQNKHCFLCHEGTQLPCTLWQDIYPASPLLCHRELVHKERTWAERPSKGSSLALKGFRSQLRVNVLVWRADVGRDKYSWLRDTVLQTIKDTWVITEAEASYTDPDKHSRLLPGVLVQILWLFLWELRGRISMCASPTTGW